MMSRFSILLLLVTLLAFAGAPVSLFAQGADPVVLDFTTGEAGAGGTITVSGPHVSRTNIPIASSSCSDLRLERS